QPHVVGRDRRALLTELAKHGRVVMRSLIVRVEHFDAVLEQELTQSSLVLDVAATEQESRSQLAEHDEGHDELLCSLENLHGFGDPFAEVDVSIRVDRDSHRHRSASTRSCSASAASTTLSAFHVPAMSLRSRRLWGTP